VTAHGSRLAPEPLQRSVEIKVHDRQLDDALRDAVLEPHRSWAR
jgi:hypothetical protein